MRIGIDLSPVYADKTGIGWYGFNLAKHLAGMPVGGHTYVMFAYGCVIGELKPFIKGSVELVEIREIKNSFLRPFLRILQMTINASRYRLDIFHSTYHVFPLTKKCRLVSTVHDLVNFIYRDKYDTAHRLLFDFLYPKLIRRSDLIIAVSENTKNDIMRVFGINPDKIYVTYEGIDAIYEKTSDTAGIQKVLDKYGVAGPYLLYVGTIEPRKNLVNLVKVFDSLKTAKNIPHKLVIAGKKGWMYSELFSVVEGMKSKNDIIFTGYVSNNDLLFLYNAAEVFIYPSLYEGFGIPPLEAMACGVPVVSSKSSSIPEVLGDAAVLAGPENNGELYKGIESLLFDENLKKKYIDKGYKRVEQFNWETAVNKTIEVYNRLKT